MGAVFAQDFIYDAFMHGPANAVEFFHGYIYSGNPMACATALGVLDTYEEDGLLTRASTLATYWQEKVHSLRDLEHVIDLRNLGLIAGIELKPRDGAPTARAFDAFLQAYDAGLLIRTTGDTIALSPPLIIEKEHIDFAFDTLRKIIANLD
jgi:beta-alanine--pyruvate transaminase